MELGSKSQRLRSLCSSSSSSDCERSIAFFSPRRPITIEILLERCSVCLRSIRASLAISHREGQLAALRLFTSAPPSPSAGSLLRLWHALIETLAGALMPGIDEESGRGLAMPDCCLTKVLGEVEAWG